MSTKTKLFNPRLIDRLSKNKNFARIFGLSLAITLWTALAVVFPANQMPFPHETLTRSWELIISGQAVYDTGITIWRTFLGFIGAMIFGSLLGIIMGTSRYGEKLLTPHVVIGLSVPAVAWAAAAMLAFGFSILTPVVATILTTFPYITLNVWKGVEDIDFSLLKMSEAFEISYKKRISQVIIPSITPQLFTASRLGLAISWKIVTIAEMFSGNTGVGYRLISAYDNFRFEEAWAWAVMFMIIILAIEYGIMKPLERRVYNYRNDADYDILY